MISLTFSKRGDWDVVTYFGPLNEDTATHLPQLKEALGSRVIFNLKGMNYINSSGIRSWVHFLRDARVNREIVYEECSVAFVMQLNMIPAFLEGATVRSVVVPFTCQDCERVTDVVYEAADFPASNDDIAPRVCPYCAKTASLAENVEEYFEFANR